MECRIKVLLGAQNDTKPNFSAIEKYRALLGKFRDKETDFHAVSPLSAGSSAA